METDKKIIILYKNNFYIANVFSEKEIDRARL